MRTEKTTRDKVAATVQEPSPPTLIQPDVATAVDREFERYRSMRAELRQRSGCRRRACLRLEPLN